MFRRNSHSLDRADKFADYRKEGADKLCRPLCFMKCILFLCLSFLFGCQQAMKEVAVGKESLPKPRFVEAELLRLKSLLAEELTLTLYDQRDRRLVWFDSSRRHPVADSLLQMIRRVEDYGLPQSRYHYNQIDSLLRKDSLSSMADVLMTDALLSMVAHMEKGVLTSKMDTCRVITTPTDNQAVAFTKRIANNYSGRGLRRVFDSLSIPFHPFLAELRSLHVNGDTIVEKKRRQLMVTIERLKHQRPKHERYLEVNIPSFKLKIIDNDSVVFTTKVIVGKPETRTPEYESVIHHFIIYPYWHVPRSILKELLPSIQSDTLYLRKHNYQVLDSKGLVVNASRLPWSEFSPEHFPYTLRQREGSENTMGVIKFVFQNPYNVYLHDTNARRLFNKEDRALSHGCVRVHNATQLARYLIKDGDIVSPEDLDQYMELQHRMEIPLPKPIPVVLRYRTVVEEDGVLNYYGDIYEKDAEVWERLIIR